MPTSDVSDDRQDEVTLRLAAFLEAQQRDALPVISDFLPDSPGELRSEVFRELAKADLEHRWLNCGLRRFIEDQVEETPDLPADVVTVDLLLEEYHLRRLAGDRPEKSEYEARFPALCAKFSVLAGDTTEAPPGFLHAGQSVQGFELLAELGRGAFAIVFLAFQRNLRRLVALKASGDSGTESQTLARLDHPNIVRIFDQRFAPEAGLRLVVMEPVSGGSLKGVIERIRNRPREEWCGAAFLNSIVTEEILPQTAASQPIGRIADYTWPELVCWLGAEIASGLSHAHRHGVTHGDVKPANVLLTPRGIPKLADFNVAVDMSLRGPARRAGGTLPYMSPEQLAAYFDSGTGERPQIEGRSDVYSLGIVLWELATGDLPFHEVPSIGDSGSVARALAERRRFEPATREGVPSWLAEQIAICVAFEPEDRFASAQEMAWSFDLRLRPRVRELCPSRYTAWQRLCRDAPATFLGGLFLCWQGLMGIAFGLMFVTCGGHVGDVCWLMILAAIGGVAFGVSANSQMRTAAKRAQVLRLGSVAAIFTAFVWMTAAALPVVREIVQSGTILNASNLVILFFAAFAVVGVFFLMSEIAARRFFPRLLRSAELSHRGTDELGRLNRRLWQFLFGSVVPIAVVLAAIEGGVDFPRPAGGWLMVGGGLMIAVAGSMVVRLQSLIATLVSALTMSRGEQGASAVFSGMV